MKKKLLSILMATMILFAVQSPIPAHADGAPPQEKGIKVETCRLDGDYYYDLSIVNNKLIAKGNWARRADPTNYNVALQLTPPILYTSPSIDGDGLASTHIGNASLKSASRSWALEETIPVTRSAECKGDKSIELTIPFDGLSDGLYNLRELVTQGDGYDSHYGDYTCVVVQGGKANLQIFYGTYCSPLMQFNTSSSDIFGIA
ncbi:hypothetical protein [Clostridium beijerinckii]|uniref:Uncharacterized protein n=1 Tax=Clostridium beijerinckii TaxID=1520 RepID=A0AAW3W6W9_CLOBE|nr:hypothetical protein [Clostridium beijerinckii]MBC2457152.1 hypothetical protein [Clostridium beijerinckii]MBC2474209.1 hypothetical protein [Clostridium beijerinckii]NOV58692.1 hypothetical protein [Clostridium beijerinckii]NOV71923.1 hypothetical protein [Clostridium beijerinckii]NOW32047.1 hypothetical protein [Clostridium beijerinckii]